jgi:hypothetical protein
MHVKPLLAVALVGIVAACGSGDGSSDERPPFLLADLTDDQVVTAMGEDFLACLDERMAADMEPLGVDPEAKPADGGGLLDIAPDADPVALVDALEQMYRACGDPADQVDRLIDAMVEGGFPRELTPCLVESGAAEQMPSDFATRVVYGPESVEVAMIQGRTQVALLRCGAPAVREEMRSLGVPDVVVDCMIEQQFAAADEIEADPAAVEVITGEAAGNARAALCVRVIPPASSRGATPSTADASLFTVAVSDELTAHWNARFAPAQADCIARNLVELVEPDRTVTAGELVDYLDGGYEPSELGLDVDEANAAELAAATIECAGTEMLRLTVLFDGNIADALGRPSEPAAENDELVECSFATADLQVLEAFLTQRFAHGPESWRAPEGRAVLEESFGAVQECADDLGIRRQEPLNGF